MKTYYLLYLLIFACNLYAQEKTVNLKFIETSDIHGNFFPYNFLEQKEAPGSLSRIHSYVRKQKEIYQDNLILIDNGDMIGGQPSVYYYNYIDTLSPHLASEIMNYMGYDIGNIGNHDIEPGRKTLERWISECDFPVLGANIIDKSTGKPFLKPYQMLYRDDVKIAVLGMITPAIPVWIPENRWEGLMFEDMEKSAAKWIKLIRKKENPDIIVGLFHSGQKAKVLADTYRDNTSLEVAKNIRGFDILMIGHDHLSDCKKITNNYGDSVLIVNPANDGNFIAEINVVLTLENGKVTGKSISGELISTQSFEVSAKFMQKFHPQYQAIQNFLSEKLGVFEQTLTTRDAYFGSSPFVDFSHSLQLEITGADISFNSPLAYDVEIKKGEITVNDIFTLYKFENFLYTIWLTGEEVKNYLERSYDSWINQMDSPDDHLLKLKKEEERFAGFNPLQHFSYYFDSAAGIIYTVDVTKSKGNRINIISMADGTPFCMNKKYTVVVNSFRGNGGGELLTKGAGLSRPEIKKRIITSTDKDMQYYLIKYIKENKSINPQPLNHWKFIPEKWTIPASKRDYDILFNSSQ